MRGRSLTTLGTAAAAARRARLGRAVRIGARAADAVLVRLRRPPLRAAVDGAVVRGYLRHRSFLAEAMRPRETYVELFVRTLREGMTVVDGGAHVGLYTMLAARGAGRDGFVVALEPDAYNLAALRINAERAGPAPVAVVAKALADAPGTATFYETPSTIGSSLLARSGGRAREVETTSIDAELAGRDVAELLVKLNVEGAELRALEGMRETLARATAATVFVEVNPPLLEDPDAIPRWLADAGFDVSYVDLPTQTPVPLPRPLRKGHLFARRA